MITQDEEFDIVFLQVGQVSNADSSATHMIGGSDCGHKDMVQADSDNMAVEV